MVVSERALPREGRAEKATLSVAAADYVTDKLPLSVQLGLPRPGKWNDADAMPTGQFASVETRGGESRLTGLAQLVDVSDF